MQPDPVQSQPPMPAEPVQSEKHMSLKLLLIPLILILFAGGYYGYRYYILKQPVTIPLMSKTFTPPIEAPAASAAPVGEKIISPVDQADKKLAYTRIPDPNKPAEHEVWIIDPVSGEEEMLELKGAASAFKHYGNSKLFYKKVNDEQGTVHILDLSTGVDRAVTPSTHPDPTVLESVSIQSVADISPDGKYFTYIVGFYLICPSPSPFPSGFEGGFGPCQPEENLESPSGYYVYDVEADKSQFIGPLDRVSRWDTAKGQLYYVSYEPYRNTKALDLKSKTITQVDTTEHFGYFTYPLLSKNLLIKNEAGTGESGTSDKSFAEMQVVDRATMKSEVFDSVDEWAVIQPFITSSEDDRYVLYIRDTNINGLHRSAIYKYDVETKKVDRLTPEDNSVSYSLQGSWIDSKTFVTAVDPIEETDFNGTNKNLVRIDVGTGKIDRLTTHNMVSYFGLY